MHTPGREGLDWDVLDDCLRRDEKKWKTTQPPGSVKLGSYLDGHDGKPIGAPNYAPETETMEWEVKEKAVAFLKQNRDKPWVMECSMHAPHPPLNPPMTYWEMIDPAKLNITRYPENDLDDGNPRYRETLVKLGLDHLTDCQIQSGMQGYYGSLAHVDAMFAEILKALDDQGLRDKTLVIYTSDHGEMLDAHRLWGKEVFFDPSVRVPLIMRLPGVIPAGKESQALVESIDMFPTMMDFVGLKTPDSVQGRSLVPLLTGKTETHRDVVRSEYPGSKSGGKDGMSLMLFDGRYKVVDNGTDIPPELYDQKTDPLEITNLQAQPKEQERLKKMLAEVRAWGTTDMAKPAPKGSKPAKNKDEE